MRKNLNADSLFAAIREDFRKIQDKRGANSTIALDDVLMSGLAVFQLKRPSLLAFDKQRKKAPQNLHSMFGITNIPCDSQMR
ncbi:MAG: transposase, partial [Desulfotalea sp.]